MNIGIDARLLERKITGIGRFLSNFLTQLPYVDSSNVYYLFTYQNLNIFSLPIHNVPTGKKLFHEKLYTPIWTNFVLPKYLKRYNIDIFFSANKIIPFRKDGKIKYISVVHDVFYKIDSSFHSIFYRKYLDIFLQIALKKSDLILTVSENSKKDIISFFNISETKIRVIYEAAAEDFYPYKLSLEEKMAIIDKYKLSEKFILYVGVIENRKNILGILKIADLVYENTRDLKFLLVGRSGYGGKNLLEEIKKRKNVIYLSYLEDSILKKIFSIARAFLFPSFYEGFGLPPLEAMQSGTPVLVSNTSSLTEVIDSGGIRHDPTDFQAFHNDLIKLVEDDEYYLEWRNKGIKRSKEFSNYKTSKSIVEVFNSMKSNI